MEIEVFVDADQLADTEEGKYRAVTAFFTYISLDKQNKPLPVPPLKVSYEVFLLHSVKWNAASHTSFLVTSSRAWCDTLMRNNDLSLVY